MALIKELRFINHPIHLQIIGSALRVELMRFKGLNSPLPFHHCNALWRASSTSKRANDHSRTEADAAAFVLPWMANTTRNSTRARMRWLASWEAFALWVANINQAGRKCQWRTPCYVQLPLVGIYPFNLWYCCRYMVGNGKEKLFIHLSNF